MSELNQQVVRRFLDEVINGRRFDLLPELFDGDFVWHGGSFGYTRGLEEFAAVVEPFYKAFPDLSITVDDLFSEDDRVVARFTVKATHQGHFLGVPAREVDRPADLPARRRQERRGVVRGGHVRAHAAARSEARRLTSG